MFRGSRVSAAAPSAQTRRNRVRGGKKAAGFVKAARRNGRFGPDESHRGSAPPIDSFATILARLRATVDSRGS